MVTDGKSSPNFTVSTLTFLKGEDLHLDETMREIMATAEMAITIKPITQKSRVTTRNRHSSIPTEKKCVTY